MLRPWVARIMSLSRGWNTISWIGTVGTLPLTRVHLPPRSGLTNKPNSVPEYSTFGFFGSSVIDVTVWPFGMPSPIDRKLLPPSTLA